MALIHFFLHLQRSPLMTLSTLPFRVCIFCFIYPRTTHSLVFLHSLIGILKYGIRGSPIQYVSLILLPVCSSMSVNIYTVHGIRGSPIQYVSLILLPVCSSMLVNKYTVQYALFDCAVQPFPGFQVQYTDTIWPPPIVSILYTDTAHRTHFSP